MNSNQDNECISPQDIECISASRSGSPSPINNNNIIKKTYVCGQTNCTCPRTSKNKIHCLDYPRRWPCYGKICKCFT